MNDLIIHDAIRSLYPNVVTIRGEESYDENNNLVDINMDLVTIEAERLSNIKPINLNDMIQELKAENDNLKEILTRNNIN
jgi:hypothetical protein